MLAGRTQREVIAVTGVIGRHLENVLKFKRVLAFCFWRCLGRDTSFESGCGSKLIDLVDGGHALDGGLDDTLEYLVGWGGVVRKYLGECWEIFSAESFNVVLKLLPMLGDFFVAKGAFHGPYHQCRSKVPDFEGLVRRKARRNEERYELLHQLQDALAWIVVEPRPSRINLRGKNGTVGNR